MDWSITALSPPHPLNRYAAAIRRLPRRTPLQQSDLFKPEFRLHSERELEIYYAPFEHLNRKARVVLVGITSGWTQMEISYRVARDALLAGASFDLAGERAKYAASFAGGTRTNLVSMLDTIGLARSLGIATTLSLFTDARSLLHTSSVIRYPVFVRGQNYNGHSPALLRNPVLRHFVEETFAAEIRPFRALVVPLGGSVQAAIRLLAERGVLDSAQCLFNFPHPSPGNGHWNGSSRSTDTSLAAAVIRWSRSGLYGASTLNHLPCRYASCVFGRLRANAPV